MYIADKHLFFDMEAARFVMAAMQGLMANQNFSNPEAMEVVPTLAVNVAIKTIKELFNREDEFTYGRDKPKII